MKLTRSPDFDLELQNGKGPNHEEEISGVHRKAHQYLPAGTGSKLTMQFMYPVLILCPGRRDPLPCPLPGYGHHQTYPRLKGIIPTRDTILGCIFMFHRCRRIFLVD